MGDGNIENRRKSLRGAKQRRNVFSDEDLKSEVQKYKNFIMMHQITSSLRDY